KSDEESIRLMHEAIDLGITFFDNAWEYHNGRAEEVMGRALRASSLREKVFLMTKICARDYEGAKRHIDDSLRRLQTDRIDLLQFHAIQYEGDAKRIAEGGLKAALEAKKAGKIRFLGFTGHRNPKAHLEMLGLPHEWDTVQMPLNVLDASYQSFEKEVLPECRRRGIAVLGMKSLGGGMEAPVIRAGVSAELARRYAMSLPVATTICGIMNRDQLHFMVRIARNFRPLSAEEAAVLVRKAQPAAAQGRLEAYKDPKQGYGCSYHERAMKSNA
ncbi:MAG: aldo/keto reductase, partial [Bryobacteraceae bacterium]|nr:aldo/keto reductase [Bryobacteraceae bacterium]